MADSLKDEFSSFFPRLDSEIDNIREQRIRLGLSTPDNIEVKLNFSMYHTGSQLYTAGIPTVFLSPLAAALADQGVWNTNEEKKLQTIGQYFNSLRHNRFSDFEKRVDDEWILEILGDPSKITNYKKELEGNLRCSFDEYSQHVQKTSPSIRSDLISFIPKLKGYWPTYLLKVLAHEIDHLDFDKNNEKLVARIQEAKKTVFSSLSRADKIDASKRFLTDYLDYAARCEGRALVFNYLNEAASQEDLRQKVLCDLNRYIEKNFVKDFLIPLFFKALAETDPKSKIKDYDVDQTFFFVLPEIQKLRGIPANLQKFDQSKVNFTLANKFYGLLRLYQLELQKNAEDISKEYTQMFAYR